MSTDFFEIIKDKTAEVDMYKYAKYAEKLYSYGFFLPIPNVARFYFEETLKNICDYINKFPETDENGDLSISQTLYNVILNYLKGDKSKFKIFKNCQKIFNENSHNDIYKNYDESEIKENAKTSLNAMYDLAKWYCNEFFEIEIPHNYNFPESIDVEDIIRRKEESDKAYDTLERELFELKKSLKSKNLEKIDKDVDNNEVKTKTQELLQEITQLKQENNQLKQNGKQPKKSIIVKSVDKKQADDEIKNLKRKLNNMINKNSDLKLLIDRLRENLSSIGNEKSKLENKLYNINVKNSIKFKSSNEEKLQKEVNALNEELIKIRKIYSANENNLREKLYEANSKINELTLAKSKSKQTSSNDVKIRDDNKKLKVAYQEASKDKDVDMQLYSDVINAIKEMAKVNAYITRNTIKTYLIGNRNAENVKYKELHKLNGFGKYEGKLVEPIQIENVLFYLEDGEIVSNNSGFYKLLVG